MRWSPCGFLTARVLALAVLLCSDAATAATFYVRTSGSDPPTGTCSEGRTPSTAFATIGRAASCAGGGDTVIVAPGRYAEGDINPRGSGRRREPVVLFADQTGRIFGDEPAGEVIVDASGFANGFRLAARQWVIINGFTVTGAAEDGIFVKSLSDSCVIANCTVFANGRRGILVRDSAGVIVFNNLVYSNGDTGVEFEGEGTQNRPDDGSPGGLILNNTVYANGLDGVRIEGVPPSENLTVLNNVITKNQGIGINLKEQSAPGFVGQWNVNTDGYKTANVSRGALDLEAAPLLIEPENSGTVPADGDFRLRQVSAGQTVDSAGVDASAFRSKKLGLANASTRTDNAPDVGAVDLGFHAGNTTDFVLKFRKSPAKRIRSLRKKAQRCDVLLIAARAKEDRGRGPCVKDRSRSRLIRRCGRAVEEACR